MLKIITPEKYLDVDLRRELEQVIEVQIWMLSKDRILSVHDMFVPLKVYSCRFIPPIKGEPEGDKWRKVFQ